MIDRAGLLSPGRRLRSMHRTATFLLALLVAALPFSARLEGQEEFTIEFFSSSFIPQVVTVQPGDRVTWIVRRGEHTVTSGSGPEDPRAGADFDVALGPDRTSFTFTIDAYRKEGYTFFCRRHPGVVGFIEVTSDERVFRVGVVDNVFLPDESYIFAGDTVRWEHEPGEDFHTITSGRSSRPEDRPGLLFDEESSDARPVFAYRFADPGVYPYFCRPHEYMGMKGTVYVQERFVRGDATADGVVDISDAIATLDLLFKGGVRRACDDALDANDDGQVDISDPVFTLGYLFTGSDRIPRPFPLPGADRTEDALNCLPEGAAE